MPEPLQLSLPESFWAAEGRRLAVLIVPRLTALALEGARRGSDKIGIGFNYGIYNLLAEQWAREYTDALLKQVRTTNEAVVGDILARWISTVGSTFGDLHAALQPYFGIKRASVIAVTEATRAMASGELLAYQRAGIEKIQWGTNKDELVCPYCGGVNREVRMIGEPFGYFRWRKGQQPEPVYAPPYHPNCRCGISPVLASVSVRKTVLILTDAAIVARTLRTLPPILAKGDFDGHPFRGNQWTDKNAAGPALNTKDKKKSAEKFNPMKPVRPSKMDAETQTLLNEWVDAGQEVVDKNFIARPQNTPSNIWYHSSREGFDISKENTGGFDFNYGSALYAGKDPSVLVEFYGTWDEENPAQVYAFRGELNMLDMRNMDDEKYYREAALDTFPDAKTPRMALRSFALAAGFDGITYFDGSATGEEHAIFNFDKLENIGVVPHKNLKKVSGPADLAKGDFDGHPFRGNQWTEVEKGIDSRGALWRRYPVRDAKGNATKNYVYAVEGGEDIPEPLVEAINKNTSEGWRMVRYNYNAKSKTWHIADAGEDDVSTHAMFAKESMELNGMVADDLVRGFYDIEQNSISIYDFTGFDNDNLIRTKATEKYLRSAERNLFTYNGEKPSVLFLSIDDMQMVAGPGDLAKHDGPGAHDNGSPQSVHGGDEDAGTAEKTGVAAIDNPYDFVRDRRNTELPMAIENGIDGGPAQSILYHGTTTKGLESLTSEHGDVYITPQPEEAAGYAMDMHRFGSKAKPGEVLIVRRRAGKTLNLTDAIDQGFENGYEPDEVIDGVRQAAKDRGFRYLYFSHPSFTDNEEQHAIISLFPEEDLRVLERRRVKKLAKHDGMGPHDNGSPQSVHGGKGKGANPAQPGAKAKRPRGKQKAAEVKVTAVAAQAPAPAAETQAPTTFEDWREAQAWAADQKSLFPDMTPEEQDALNKYKRSSKYYAQVNSYLRTGKFKGGEYIENAFSDGGQVESYAQILDSAIGKTSLEGDVVVYRALASKAIPVGTKEFMDKGFGSTSLAKSQGKRFVGFVKDDGQTPAIMNIKVPKGAKAIYTETLWDNGEAELLLPRNTKYRIISEGRNEDGIRIINAEVINE